MVSLKKKSESLIKYYIKVTCALKWARKLPRKTETYESAKCVPCNTRKCTHNGFVSDLLKWALKCRFYATGPRPFVATLWTLSIKEDHIAELLSISRKESRRGSWSQIPHSRSFFHEYPASRIPHPASRIPHPVFLYPLSWILFFVSVVWFEIRICF